MMQLTNSTDTALETSLVDSQKMVKQATNIWEFTGKRDSNLECRTLMTCFVGAPVTDLATTSVWATKLLEDYHLSSRLGALRFATTTGLEQTTNSTYSNTTFNGIRVLSHVFYGGGISSSENAGSCFFPGSSI